MSGKKTKFQLFEKPKRKRKTFLRLLVERRSQFIGNMMIINMIGKDNHDNIEQFLSQ